ncbi:F-box domain-containing protein [Artemisia annua]|uniref:F-box domain-containing protein n=1 Tax=Artemisia annua TaxID=35608 RepID=A0A2U1KA54_ARTAN|nr:F-box domain-containing protein [Artemisia annua]
MADVHISDHILYNILARLPQKSLLRFQCVSKHWNHLIKDPYLMKLRSNIRRMILLSHERRLLTTDDTTNLVVEVSSFLGPVDILGTFNGIVLLLVKNNTYIDNYYVHQLILYNPVTRVSKILPDSPSPAVLDNGSHYTFGFGYDTTTDDLNIVRFRSGYCYIHDKCDVFSFKKNSWENIQHTNIQEIQFRLRSVGKYLNGFLYWIGYSKLDEKLAIVALNVKDMLIIIYCTSNASLKKLNGTERLKGLNALCGDGIEYVESLSIRIGVWERRIGDARREEHGGRGWFASWEVSSGEGGSRYTNTGRVMEEFIKCGLNSEREIPPY